MTDEPQPSTPEPLGPREPTISAAGDVNIAGDVVGRDKITQENVAGDKVLGDKIEKVVQQELSARGKYVVQIGQLNVPLLPLAGGLGAALVLLILIGVVVSSTGQQVAQLQSTPTPVAMSGDFNVVVAEFGEEAAGGTVRAGETGRQLSRTVFETLSAQRDALPDAILKPAIALRYEAAPAAGPVVTAAEEAAALAERVKADMVVYGTLDAQGGFIPKFFIAPRVRGQMEATAGDYQLGAQPIRFGATDKLASNLDLRVRTSALLYLMLGLTYDAFGRVEQSLDLYRQAEEQLSGWAERGEGKEVLYFFKAQAALYVLQRAAERDRAALDAEALEALERGLFSNPDFSRTHIALGSLYLLRLQAVPDLAAAWDSPDLNQMFEQYRQGVALAERAGDRQTAAIASFGLGGATYLLGGVRQFRGEIDEAVAAYEDAIGLIDASRAPLAEFRQTRLLAQANLALGAVYDQLGQLHAEQGDAAASRSAWERAGQAYAQCVALGQNSQDRILVDLIVGQRCQPSLDKVQQRLSGG